jgi:hypothetical protein
MHAALGTRIGSAAVPSPSTGAVSAAGLRQSDENRERIDKIIIY